MKKDLFVKKEVSSKLRKKSVSNAQNTNLNKRDFVKSLLKQDANIIWPREMKIVKTLFTIFPDEVFWNSLNLGFKLNSLCWLLSDDGRKLLNTEYKKFKLSLPEQKNYKIKENNIAFETKTEYDEKPLNLREFLNLWQKKH
jgi:hypothetical protein